MGEFFQNQYKRYQVVPFLVRKLDSAEIDYDYVDLPEGAIPITAYAAQTVVKELIPQGQDAPEMDEEESNALSQPLALWVVVCLVPLGYVDTDTED